MFSRFGHASEMTSLLRLRQAYLTLAAVALGLLLLLLMTGGAPLGVRLAGAGLILTLLAHTVDTYRRGGPAWYANPFEAIALLGIGLSLESMDRTLGFIFPSLLLRATYGGPRQTLTTTAAYLATLTLGLALLMPDGSGLARAVSLSPMIAVTALIAGLLRNALEERASLLGELRSSERRFRSLVQNSSDMIMIIDHDRTIRYHTPSVKRVLGYDSLVGTHLDAILHADDQDAAASYLGRASHETAVSSEWRLLHRNGSWLHVEAVSSGTLEDPSLGGVVLTIRDVSERKALEQRLTHQALHDGLTDLPNRALLREEIHDAIDAARAGRQTLAVLFIDLDDFKTVNDALGHLVGDELLVQAAERFKACLRPGDVAARLGGDEFALLLPRLTRVEDAEAVARRVITTLELPFDIAGQRVSVHASIGIALSERGAVVTEDLLRDADIAMYVAKSRGRGRYEVFRPGMRMPTAGATLIEANAPEQWKPAN